MTLYWKYLGPGFDSRHLHQLFNNMQKLFENWRKYINEVDDPDSDADDAAELRDIADDIESKSTGMKTIDGLGPGIEITIEEQLPDDVDIYFSEVEDPGEPGYGEPSGIVSLDLVSNVLPKFRSLRVHPISFCTTDKKLWQMHVQERITHGWGPILYDIAMEWATMNGNGLIADRNAVSGEAWEVWDYYLQNRKDVQAHQLDDLENTLTPEDPDNCDQEVAADPGDKWGLETSPISKYYTKSPVLINKYKDTRIKIIQ